MPLVLTALALGAVGCAGPAALEGAAPVSDPRVRAALAADEPLVETVEWAVLDGLVSVVARNETDRVLTAAEAVVTVRDSAGQRLRPVTDDATTLAADVPPGATYAFTLDLGPGADVHGVEVAFRRLSWSGRDPSGRSGVQVEPALLTANEYGAVIGARATTSGDAVVGSAVVQARLQGPDGRLLAVASTAATCFDPRVPRRVWLQLPRQVPAGTVVGQVVAHPRHDTEAAEGVPPADC